MSKLFCPNLGIGKDSIFFNTLDIGDHLTLHKASYPLAIPDTTFANSLCH